MFIDGTAGCLKDFFGDMIRQRNCLSVEVNVTIENRLRFTLKKIKNFNYLIQNFNLKLTIF